MPATRRQPHRLGVGVPGPQLIVQSFCRKNEPVRVVIGADDQQHRQLATTGDLGGTGNKIHTDLDVTKASQRRDA